MSAGPYNEERQALIEDDIKVISGRGRFLNLYDLGQDPEEHQDLIGNASLVARMRERFDRFKSTLRPVHVPQR
jgi:hypothetical protein